MDDEPLVMSDRKKLQRILDWVSAHRDVADVDAAAERALSAIGDVTTASASLGGDVHLVESISNLLNELLDTVGNCEIEERNAKAQLWSQAVSSAASAGDILRRIDRGT